MSLKETNRVRAADEQILILGLTHPLHVRRPSFRKQFTDANMSQSLRNNGLTPSAVSEFKEVLAFVPCPPPPPPHAIHAILIH